MHYSPVGLLVPACRNNSCCMCLLEACEHSLAVMFCTDKVVECFDCDMWVQFLLLQERWTIHTDFELGSSIGDFLLEKL